MENVNFDEFRGDVEGIKVLIHKIYADDYDPATGAKYTKKIRAQMVEAFDLTIDLPGNVLIYYASRPINTAAQKLRATIKGHNERGGVKQTVVTRCSVVAA